MTEAPRSIVDCLTAEHRGSTQGIVATLNASSGSPSIASAKTGRLVGGDIDGDGNPDLIATCSN